jgi:hypothetical protein
MRALLAALALSSVAAPAVRAESLPAEVPVTYADLADLADSASLVARAKISKAVRVEPARASNVRPGWARFFVTAKTLALLSGAAPLGAEMRYLVDLPLDARGRAPRIAKQVVIVFARPVAARPGEIQLVAPDAQVPWSLPAEGKLREILYELLATDAPGRVSGVREAIHVPGTLRGEGETQIFLASPDNRAASIMVQHKPSQPAQWGAPFSEVVATVGPAPQPDTLAWYRLACFLPNSLPPGANLSETPESRAQADGDYRMVLGELGVCPRKRV